MFGLFESKEAKFWRQETINTLKQADNNFNDHERKQISKLLLLKILKTIKRYEGLSNGEKREVVKIQMDEVGKLRRENNNERQFYDPKWIEYALLESFIHMNSGAYGKKLGKEAVMIIYWARSNLSDNEIDDIVNEVGISKEKSFGDYN